MTSTNVVCYGQSTGTAGLTVSGGGTSLSNNCLSSQVPGSTEQCTSGCTSTITTNANATVASGQKVCITANNYSGQIQLDAGGVAVLCGTSSTASIVFNGGKLVVLGSITPSVISYWSAAGSSIVNYGTLSFSSSTTLEIALNNHGTLNASAGLTMGYNSTGFTNTGTVNISSGNLVFQNSGTSVNHHTITLTSGNLTVDWSKTFTNNCTLTVSGTLTNHGTFSNTGTITLAALTSDGGAFTNNNKITVSGTTSFTGGTVSTGAGSEISSGSFTSSVAINGTGGSCSSIKATTTTFGWGTSFTGQARYCDLNGTIESNAPNVTTNVSLTTCACNVSGPTCTYSWKNSSNVEIATTQNVSNLAAGTYTVSATCTGCSNSPLTSSVTITQPAALQATTSSTATCTGGSNGSVTVTASGGLTPYSYSWTNSSSIVVGATQTVAGLPGGSYTVVVKDASNCTISKTVQLNQPSASLAASATHIDASCGGASDGSINLSVSGGTTPYTYQWSPGGQTTEDLSGLAAGTYTVLVVDAASCSTQVSITITQPETAQISITKTDVTSYGLNDGTATVIVTPPAGMNSVANNCNTTAPIDCSAGCTSTINANTGNVNLSNSADKVCLTGTITTGDLNVNAATLVICGTVTSGAVNITNGGRVVVTGSGSLTISGAASLNNTLGCSFENYGYVHVSGSFNNNGTFLNNKELILDGSLNDNNGASGTNNCTLTIHANIALNGMLNNNGSISADAITYLNADGILNMSNGAELSTNSIQLNGTINGPPSGTCASVKVGGASFASAVAVISGVVSVCDATPAGSGDNIPSGLAGYYNCNCQLSSATCSILWSNGQTTVTATNLAPGEHTVTVTCGGCSVSGSVTIKQTATLLINTVNVNPGDFTIQAPAIATLNTQSGLLTSEVIISPDLPATGLENTVILQIAQGEGNKALEVKLTYNEVNTFTSVKAKINGQYKDINADYYEIKNNSKIYFYNEKPLKPVLDIITNLKNGMQLDPVTKLFQVTIPANSVFTNSSLTINKINATPLVAVYGPSSVLSWDGNTAATGVYEFILALDYSGGSKIVKGQFIVE